jgi:type I restriction enzyme M protein
LKAHDNGEFFTPVSLVSLIANVIEPRKGIVLDPACGSGGMFVQSAHFVEKLHQSPSERLTFYGLEKNQTTIPFWYHIVPEVFWRLLAIL